MALVQFFEQNTLWFLSFIFLIGLSIGSFLNVVIYRYPIMLQGQWKNECEEYLAQLESNDDAPIDETNDISKQDSDEKFNLVTPRSRCPHCGHQISALENIPILSWLFLKARCSECKTKISARYPLVELITALLSVLVAYYFGPSLFTLALLFLTWVLIALTLIDYDTQLLPDDMTLPLMWLGLLLSVLGISPIPIYDALIGAMAGYMSLWTVFHVFKLVTGKEGMGYGDFKLLAALGAWLGWQMLPQVLFLSAVVGAVVGISLILIQGRDKNRPIPFGPYLASAGFIALIWGGQINQFYLG